MSTGLLDTSVVIDWDDGVVTTALPDEAAISAVTLAELAAGPHLAASRAEGARRQTRLQQVEATFEPLAFDAATARSYGLLVAAVVEHGRFASAAGRRPTHRGHGHAHGLDLYTRNPDDFAGLEHLLSVVGI